jgi:glycine/D-amino acid oxidase-like deaminating enzyme/nitrite reductase/ring-hydroxylating ferredoxin subunit
MLDHSLWRTIARPHFSGPLPREVDVVVIGGGITGLTTAYLLQKSGKTVAVLDRDRIGSGETGNTSAHLTYVTDLRLTELAKRFGRDAARLVWEGGDAAIDLIERHIASLSIDCGFRRVPNLLSSPFFNETDAGDSLREDKELAVELGFAATYVPRGPITGRPAVAFADQALFHPLQYLVGLASAINGEGSVVREIAEVGEVIDDPLGVIVNGETIVCKDVVIATHVPLAGIRGMIGATLLQTKLYPYSSYVLGARVGRDAPSPGLYSDTADPYHYLRIHEDSAGRYAIFGGNDHKTGQETDTDSRFADLETKLLQLLPSARVEHRWTGQIIETSDGLPFVGTTSDHQVVATGYAGNGLTFGTLAGMMLHDCVMQRSNPLHELFDPQRKAKSAGSIATFVAENVDYPFYLIADRVRPHGGDVESVAPGEGKVLTLGGRRVACHRTPSGELIKVSAVCTHLGCLVRWNNADATWDCPCHGSRFTPEGLVLGGPAESPLEQIED